MSVKSPDKIDMEVGQRIKVQRLAVNLSQTALAVQLGVTFQQVRKYEKGINRVSLGRLTKIAQVLGVPVGRLFGVDDEGRAPRKGQQVDSPLNLIVAPGAARLLRAYGMLKDHAMRRSIVGLIESLTHRPVERAKKP